MVTQSGRLHAFQLKAMAPHSLLRLYATNARKWQTHEGTCSQKTFNQQLPLTALNDLKSDIQKGVEQSKRPLQMRRPSVDLIAYAWEAMASEPWWGGKFAR